MGIRKFFVIKSSRRAFLIKGLLTSLLISIRNTSSKANNKDNDEIVKLLKADGTLVQVPKKFIPKYTGKRISTRELFTWKKANKS